MDIVVTNRDPLTDLLMKNIFTFLFTYDEFVLFVVTADVSRILIHY